MSKSNFNWIIFLTLIPNLIFMALSYRYDFFRPLINIDYFFVCALYLFSPWFFLLYFIIFFIEAFLIINQIYPIYYISELFVLAGDASSLPFFVILKIALFIAFFILFTASFIFFRKKIKLSYIEKKSYSFVLVIFFLFLVFFCQISMDNFFINSQVGVFLKKRNNYVLNQQSYDIGFNSPIYSQIINDYKNEEKILLIVNESYGYFKDKKINHDIIKSIVKQQKNFKLFKYGYFPYKGVTIGGEFRELCDKNSRGVDFDSLQNAYSDCIPLKMKKSGFTTVAVHGGDEDFYKRKLWYPKVGFSEIYFDKKFPDLKNCKAFNGKCDSDLMSFIASKFTGDSKKFIYWLTISTHEPYDEKIVDSQRINCSVYNLADTSLVCKNIKLQAQFFDQLSVLVENPAFRGVHVYIVGDHPPPIWDQREKEKYLEQSVSWVSFKIK